jgi:uncharacterized protein YidB (DUF937 family)
MGLLDGVLGNVLGSVMGGGQQQQANPMLNIVLGMLANNSGQQGGGGGLGGMLQQFQQAGMGDVIGSWIGKGDNLPISADQLQSVLGSGALGDIAKQLGMSQGETAGQLSQILPDIINQLTPNGEAPEGGLGSAGDIMGMLGGLMKR